MKPKLDYASVAVIDFSNKELIAVEVVSITNDGCDLSGAWLLKNDEISTLQQIVKGRGVLYIGKNDEISKSLESLTVILSLEHFLVQAQEDALKATKGFSEFVEQNLHEYEKYMTIPPAERKLIPKVARKNLVAPTFATWPQSIRLEQSETELEVMGKLSVISGSQSEMRRVLAASRLLQILINMWKSDEQERANRLYVQGSESEISILPNLWIDQLAQLTN